MKRFYFGNDEGDDEDEEDLEDPRFMMPDPSEFIAMTRFENPEQNLMDLSIRICEKSLFWMFFGVARKMSMITRVFTDLNKLQEGIDDAQV